MLIIINILRGTIKTNSLKQSLEKDISFAASTMKSRKVKYTVDWKKWNIKPREMKKVSQVQTVLH